MTAATRLSPAARRKSIEAVRRDAGATGMRRTPGAVQLVLFGPAAALSFVLTALAHGLLS